MTRLRGKGSSGDRNRRQDEGAAPLIIQRIPTYPKPQPKRHQQPHSIVTQSSRTPVRFIVLFSRDCHHKTYTLCFEFEELLGHSIDVDAYGNSCARSLHLG